MAILEKSIGKKASRVHMALLSTALIIGAVLIFSIKAYSADALPAEGVKPIEVCMVTDKVFHEPQIPVLFNGKTYYGCCQGCVGKIKSNRAVRYSIDPVSGVEVDKATAFIVEGGGGEALYFESAKTAKQYSADITGHDGPVK